MPERHALTLLPGALRDAGFDDAPTYRATWTAAVNGTIPARRNKAGRWEWSPEDLPAIAEGLGLDTPAETAAA